MLPAQSRAEQKLKRIASVFRLLIFFYGVSFRLP
jgi:hypothetical protein